MNSNKLRQLYLDFFKEKGHAIISGASLIPENDPTVLFTTAGMHPLVPYLLGEKHPAGSRLTSAQKCIRTGDIEEVGDRTHHTFFEMMGNWSLGGYFKKDSINYSWEFLTSPQWLGLDKNRLAVSVFEGDEDAGFDEEAYNIWVEIFKANNLPLERIAKLPKKNNWWGPAGLTGPCGPDTEIFYWTGETNNIPGSFNDDNDFWVEIWNNVFMEYNKKTDGSFEVLSQKNVDTGLGLERVSAILNGLDDNYQGDLFLPLIEKIENLSGKKYNESEEIKKAMRIIADHIKAAVMIIADKRGVAPSNTDQGYVVRRLIRRAVRYGRQLEIKSELWLKDLAEIVINIYNDFYPELKENQEFLFENLNKEQIKFEKTLEKGLLEFNKISNGDLDAKAVFNLYQSYGFPLEITEELAREKNIKIDKEGFLTELKKHQELSRTASAGKFKGGLADAGEETVKLHTAAHLLLAALRKVLGDHVVQKGSNITAERLRFDFSHPEKVSPEKITEIENIVNQAIKNDYQVVCEEMSLETAKARGAMGVFDSKYSEQVKVYTVGYLEEGCANEFKEIFSSEICGGPHVKNTGILGNFKVKKEEASSSGVRRIKAVLEN
ncbi:alanine--tRNA ligase [Patescibacteria group bacterium]|nr:alanine--tRNA ligase [Patescibacteria group bacterium]